MRIVVSLWSSCGCNRTVTFGLSHSGGALRVTATTTRSVTAQLSSHLHDRTDSHVLPGDRERVRWGAAGRFGLLHATSLSSALVVGKTAENHQLYRNGTVIELLRGSATGYASPGRSARDSSLDACGYTVGTLEPSIRPLGSVIP